MSKESRRAARLARESRRAGGTPREPGAGAGSAGAGSTSAPSGGPGGSPATRSTGRPVSGVGARAGRRDRVRSAPPKTFLERYRTAIVTVAAVAIVAVAVGYVFIGTTSASYTCGSQFNPSPTPPVTPGSSSRLGFFEEDMGRTHITATPVKYLFCPPASGNHFGNNQGVTGPIPPRLYKPDDKVGPPNWIHNLEHGALVILYRNDSPGAAAAGQQAFRDYISAFPPSPICKLTTGQLSPVIARFDDMPHAYAALVWDRVLYLDTWDPAIVTQFYLTESERLDSTGTAFAAPPEPQCAAPSGAPSASGPAPSDVPAASSSLAPSSAAPSAAPSVGPSASPEPSAAPS